MSTRAGGDLVLVRAVVVAVLSLALAAVAHVSAGGLIPGWWTLVVMVALCAVASALWLDRQASRLRLAGLLVAGQTTIHVAMTALAGHGEESGPASTSVAGTLRDAAGHLAHDLTPAHAPMVLAHLVAAAATGLLLARGERALWALLGLVARAVDSVALRLPAPLRVPTAPVVRRVVPLERTRPVRHQWLLRDTHARRGPPAYSCAA